MRKNPRSCVTRPDVFKYPWVVVSPESVLKLGRVYFLVPWYTIRGLLKKHGLPENYHSLILENSDQEWGNFPRAKLTSREELWAEEQDLDSCGGCSISNEPWMEFSRLNCLMKNLEVSDESCKQTSYENIGNWDTDCFKERPVSSSPVRNIRVLEKSFDKSSVDRKKKSPAKSPAKSSVKLNKISPMNKSIVEPQRDLEMESSRKSHNNPRINNLTNYKNSPKLEARSSHRTGRILQPTNDGMSGVNIPQPVTELKSCLKKNGGNDKNLTRSRLRVRFYITD
jgi:hypothetical protein